MARKRVVITGMGSVSCFGTDVDVFYNQLLAGKSGITPIDSFPCEEYPTRFAGSVRHFDTGEYVDKKQARRVDPCSSFTMVAGKKALEMAGLKGETLEPLDKTRCGILIGSGMGGMQVYSGGVQTLLEKGFKRLTPFFVPFIITNMGGALLAIDLGFMGPNYSISTACATSNYCIHAAAEHIRKGESDLIVAGGSEAAVTPIGLAGFVACKALSERNDAMEKASRPWDKSRDGFVMGDGCGALVLESLEHAQARGATILAEYLGGAISCDASHITDPRSDGLGITLCANKALEDAGITHERVNYINAHATSTQAGDLGEMMAMKNVFGQRMTTGKIAANATKSMIGHGLGAAGGFEAIAVIKAIQMGKLHPTINLDQPEEALEGMDLVPNQAKDYEIDVALSNSFGFGGHNSCLLFAPFRP